MSKVMPLCFDCESQGALLCTLQYVIDLVADTSIIECMICHRYEIATYDAFLAWTCDW